MDEQRAWIKSRRKKRLRILAAGTQNGDGTVYVTAFESLPEEVREQTVPLGTGMEELTLPDTLEAFVAIAEEEDASEDKEDASDKKENPDDSDPKEDNTVSGAGTDTETGTEETDGETDDETGTEENGGGETEGETHTVTLPVYAAENELTIETLEDSAEQTAERTEPLQASNLRAHADFFMAQGKRKCKEKPEGDVKV